MVSGENLEENMLNRFLDVMASHTGDPALQALLYRVPQEFEEGE